MSDLIARLRDADTTRRIGESYADTHERRQRDREEAAARIEQLEAALRPFANIKADDGDDFSKWPDQVIIKCEASVREIKAARAALGNKP